MSRLLAFGTYDREQHPRIGVIIDGMHERGWEVAELDRPLGLSTAERVRLLRRPWLLPALALRLASRWAGLALGSLRHRGAAHPEAVLVGYLGHFDVLLARILFPRTPIVLDHLIFAAGTAADRGTRSRALLTALRGLDRLATGAADVVVVDTVEHGARLAPALSGRAEVVPVGATRSWFEAGDAAAESPREEGPLSIVFFGLFTPLQGAPDLARALAALHRRGTAVRATLIGSGQDLEECREILADVPGIRWEDWVPGAELPAEVAAHDVCLGILGTTAKAQDVVPNKVYQGVAAGCAVLTSDTAPQRRALGGTALLVPAGEPEALAEELRRLAEDPDALAAARAAARAGREAFLPAAVVEGLDRRLRETVDGSRR